MTTTYLSALTEQAGRARRDYERLLEAHRLIEPDLGERGVAEAMATIDRARRQADAYEAGLGVLR